MKIQLPTKTEQNPDLGLCKFISSLQLFKELLFLRSLTEIDLTLQLEIFDKLSVVVEVTTPVSEIGGIIISPPKE